MHGYAIRRPSPCARIAVGLTVCAAAALGVIGYPAATQAQTSDGIAAAFMSVPAALLKPVSAPRSDQDAFLVVANGEPMAEVIGDRHWGRVTGVYGLTAPDTLAGAPTMTAGECAHAAYAEAARLYPEGGDSFTFDTVRALPSEAKCNAYLFMWAERQGPAYTGRLLNVSVWATTGEARHAFLRLPPAGGPLAVAVTETEALQVAGRAIPEVGLTGQATLVLSSPLAPDEGPAWLVEVTAHNGRCRDTVPIDARSGEVLRPTRLP